MCAWAHARAKWQHNLQPIHREGQAEVEEAGAGDEEEAGGRRCLFESAMKRKRNMVVDLYLKSSVLH